MIAGLLLHAAGFAAQQTRISIVAFLIFTWGVMRLAGGRRWGDAAMFPLAFMVFAIPVSVLDEVGLPLRLWVTSAGERIAHLAGIDVIRSGTQLVAPDGRFNYDVAAPCSGVRSLMALTALSVLIGYLNFRTWWRRGLVLGLCLPLVYVGNVARIVAIVFAAQAGGAEWGDRAHVVMGYGVFVIVLGGILVAVAAIHRWWPEGQETGDRGQEPGDRGRGTGDRGRGTAHGGRMRWMAVTAGMVALMIAEMIFLHRLEEMPPRGKVGVVLAEDGLNPVELPAFLGTEWIGQRAEVSPAERDILPADTGYSRKNYAFVSDRTRDVFLSIVLSGRDRTSIHRPELCLVGQGWTIESAMQHTFRHPAGRDSHGGVLY
jgi:exosortase